jgi:DNA adenine methylase
MQSPIRWVGSKRKLVNKIIKYIPKNFNTYYELFAGSCSLLFKIEPSKAVISDTNQDLICFYKILKTNVEELIEETLKFDTNEKAYYKIRAWDRNPNWPYTELKRATRFLYLNRTCFNGVWRVNSKGYFNVPFRKSENIDFKIELLKAASLKLQNVEIFNENFTFFINKIKEGDFVYLDPPYLVNANCGPSNYNLNDFSYNLQLKLVHFCKILDKKNVKFVLSNSYSKESIKLYSNFNIEIIDVKRCVGSLKKTRKYVQEILVSNHKIDK